MYNRSTIPSALNALERHGGFLQKRTVSIARQLQAAGILSLGAPGVAPSIDHEGFAALLIAAAADNTVREAPETVRAYFALTPGGTPLAGSPSTIASAQSALLALIETALQAPGDLAGVNLEFVTNFHELVVHWPDGLVHRFQPVGVVSGRWQVTSHRRATLLLGSAFVEAVRSTFGAN